MRDRPQVEIVVGKVVPWPEDGSRKFRRDAIPEPQMFIACKDWDDLPPLEHNAANEIMRTLEEATGGGILQGWPKPEHYCHVWRAYVRFRMSGLRRLAGVTVSEWVNFKYCSAEGQHEARKFAQGLRDAFRKRAEVAQ